MSKKQIDTNADVGLIEFDEMCGLKVGCGGLNVNWDELRQGDINAIGSKLSAFVIYFQYFSNIAMSRFKYNVGDIPVDYIQRALFQDGRLAFFNGAILGMSDTPECSTFRWGDTFDHYGRLTQIELFNSLANTSDSLSGQKLERGQFEVLYDNKTRTSLWLVVYYFCKKIMEEQTAIDNNLANNSLPVAVECTREQLMALNNIIMKVQNLNRFIFFRKEKNARPEDLFKALDINIEFKADKMLEVVNYYKGEFYTMLGINSTPYEKKERLLRDEVKSNNQILALTLDSSLSTQKECFERINKLLGTDYSVELNYSVDITSSDNTIDNKGGAE